MTPTLLRYENNHKTSLLTLCHLLRPFSFLFQTQKPSYSTFSSNSVIRYYVRRSFHLLYSLFRVLLVCILSHASNHTAGDGKVVGMFLSLSNSVAIEEAAMLITQREMKNCLRKSKETNKSRDMGV